MPRAIWKGSISFGLVTIPVELHTAVRDHRPRFRMLLKVAALSKDKAIDIMAFVKADEVDDRYVETPCYLTPDQGGQHAYDLMKLIKARMKGEKPRLPAAHEEPQGGEAVDLMERLRQSLESRHPSTRRVPSARSGRAAKSTRASGRKASHAA